MLILVLFNLCSVVRLEFLFQHSTVIKIASWILTAKWFCVEAVPKAAHSIYFLLVVETQPRAGSFLGVNPQSLPPFVCVGRGKENGDTEVGSYRLRYNC